MLSVEYVPLALPLAPESPEHVLLLSEYALLLQHVRLHWPHLLVLQGLLGLQGSRGPLQAPHEIVSVPQ